MWHKDDASEEFSAFSLEELQEEMPVVINQKKVDTSIENLLDYR